MRETQPVQAQPAWGSPTGPRVRQAPGQRPSRQSASGTVAHSSPGTNLGGPRMTASTTSWGWGDETSAQVCGIDITRRNSSF